MRGDVVGDQGDGGCRRSIPDIGGAHCGVSEARRIGDSVVVVSVGGGLDLFDDEGIRGEAGGGDCAACTSFQKSSP